MLNPPTVHLDILNYTLDLNTVFIKIWIYITEFDSKGIFIYVTLADTRDFARVHAHTIPCPRFIFSIFFLYERINSDVLIVIYNSVNNPNLFYVLYSYFSKEKQ